MGKRKNKEKESFFTNGRRIFAEELPHIAAVLTTITAVTSFYFNMVSLLDNDFVEFVLWDLGRIVSFLDT